MASTDEEHPKTGTSKLPRNEAELSETAVSTRRAIPAEYYERRKTIRPEDLFKSHQRKDEGGELKLGAWEDGKIGAEIGKALYELYQSYEEWSNDQEDFVKDTVAKVMAGDYISKWQLNVFVWSDEKSEFWFTNPHIAVTDDYGWLGILDKTYYIAVFECCWFMRHGPGGFRNWEVEWWGGDWYGRRGSWEQGDEKMVVTYKSSPKSAGEIMDGYESYTDSADTMHWNLIKTSSTWHNDQPTWSYWNPYGEVRWTWQCN